MSEDLEPIEKVEPPCQIYYLQSSSGKVYRCYRTSEADKFIADLEESHKKDVEKLLMEIAKLKDAQRWRKYPEEKPSEDTRYIICGSSGFRDADRWMYLKEKQQMGFGFHDYGVKYWMPMPKAPEEADK